MGTGDTNGSADNSGPPEPLAGLPPEWGRIVVPDDAAELAAEAAQVRRELRRRHRSQRLQGRERRPARAPFGYRDQVTATTLMITGLAVLAALAGLLAVVWPGQQRPTTGGRPAPAPTGPDHPDRTVPALDLVGETGAPVSLRGLLPAIIVLIDGCDCTEQLVRTARTAPPGVTVVAVTSGRPAPGVTLPEPAVGSLRALADPAAELRDVLPAPPANPGATLLVDRTGKIIQILPKLDDLANDPDLLARLTAPDDSARPTSTTAGTPTVGTTSMGPSLVPSR